MSDGAAAPSVDTSDPVGSVDFNYQKSPGYRTIHVDGALASGTPRGLLAVTFFNERAIIPRLTRRQVSTVGEDRVVLGEEVPVEGANLKDIMRQIELTAFMDLQSARELRDMLNRMIALVEGDAVNPELGESNVG